jgi:hypothetical protein
MPKIKRRAMLEDVYLIRPEKPGRQNFREPGALRAGTPVKLVTSSVDKGRSVVLMRA